MPKLVALEWDARSPREARAILARTKGRDFVVEDAFTIDSPEGAESGTLAETITEVLTGRGIARSDVLVAIGRSMIELRSLQLPPVPPEELPDLVRFQAMRQFANIGDDWPLDFVQLAANDPDTIQVLAASVDPDAVKNVRNALTAAELNPKRMGLRPFAVASLLRRSATPTHGCVLVVDLLGEEAELTVMVDQQVGFIRTVRLPTVDNAALERALIGELRRTIGAAQNQLAGQRVDRVVFCGDSAEHSELKSVVEREFSLPAELFDPFANVSVGRGFKQRPPEHPGRYASLLGMLADEAAGDRPDIDFLNPRQKPPPESKTVRNSLLMVAAAAAVLALILGVTLHLWRLDSRIAALKSEGAKLNKTVDVAKTRQRHLATMEQQFVDVNTNWLEELRELSRDFSSPDQSIVTQLTISANPATGSRMILEGYVDQSAHLRDLEEGLRDSRHRVVGKGSQYDPNQERFRWRFNETITVVGTSDADEPEAEPGSSGDPAATDTPGVAAAAEDTSATNSPASEDAPSTDTPAEDAPKTDTPAEDAPSTDTPGEVSPASDPPATDTPSNGAEPAETSEPAETAEPVEASESVDTEKPEGSEADPAGESPAAASDDSAADAPPKDATPNDATPNDATPKDATPNETPSSPDQPENKATDTSPSPAAEESSS